MPTSKPLPPVAQRVAELRDNVDVVLRSAAPPPPCQKRPAGYAHLAGLIPLALPELVRAKRRLHGKPEVWR